MIDLDAVRRMWNDPTEYEEHRVILELADALEETSSQLEEIYASWIHKEREIARLEEALEQAQEKVASLQSSMDDMVDIDSEYIYRLKDDLARAEETIEQVRAWRRSKDLRGQLPDSAHEELIAILAAHTKETP